MAADTINGVSGYKVDVVGTKTHWIPSTSLLASQVTMLEAGKAAQAAVSGYQVINVGGNKTGGMSTGLANGTYKLKIGVDSAAQVEINVTIAGGFNTYTDLITAIDAGIAGASLACDSALVAGNIKVTSNAVSNASKISMADGATAGLLAALTATLNAAVDANVKTWLMGQTLVGVSAWDVLKSAVLVFNTKGQNELLTGADLVDAGGSYSQGAQQAIVDVVNALKHTKRI